MPEEYGIAESVTGTDASVAIDPSLLSKPVQPDAQPANGDDELLKHKLGLANQHAKKAKQEADEIRRQFDSLSAEMNALKEAQQSAVRENLQDQGAFKELWEKAEADRKALQTSYLKLEHQNQELVTQGETERLKSAALQQISSSSAVNPGQLYTLLQPKLRANEDGHPVLLSSGVEQTLVDYLANLKASADWQHHFSASSARGMGAGASTTSVAPGMTNPYRTKNFTEVIKLEASNPELAKQLKAEALRGS